MKCKNCGILVKDGCKTVQYIKKNWKGAGKFAGSPEYIEEVVIDGGVFCSDVCLTEYLTKK